MTTELPEPKSRKESYLAKAAGEDVTIPEKPLSRLEQYLDAIAEGGGGGGGGTSDFDELSNRPKYNNAIMSSETNIPEVIDNAFTGTDGTSTGVKGLVPAPATTDAGKFLKADGTWAEASGGGGSNAIHDLTPSDYNFDPDGRGHPTDVAIWRLASGIYTSRGGVTCYMFYEEDDIVPTDDPCLIVIQNNQVSGDSVYCTIIDSSSKNSYEIDYDTGEKQ